MKALVKAWCVVLMTMSITACTTLGSSKEEPQEQVEPQHYYVIDVDRGLREHDRSQGKVLYLAPIKVTSQFRAKNLVFKVDDNAFQPLPDHEFFDKPQDMFTVQLQRWLKKTGFFSDIITTNSQNADYVLEAAVTGLYGDKREGHPPQSVLEMQFFLTDTQAQQEEVVFQTGLHIDIDITETTPSKVVNGWKTGLTKLLSTLEDDLSSYFSNNTP